MDEGAAASSPGKRGRRQGLPDPAAGPVAAFARALCALKLEAGDPSYDRMRTDLGAMASKSALSAAARGRDLPSWETTWEFVRSLTPADADLEAVRRDWLDRWEAARDAGGPVPRPVPATATRPAWRRDRRLVALGMAVGVTAGGVIWALVAAAPTAPAVPPIAGDASAFVTDVNVPDGTVVPPGERFVKTWEIRNAGTVAWTGRYLERVPDLDGAACRTPQRVPVPATEPGATVRVSVPVDTPPGPAECKVRWKMVDEQGRSYFPGLRPVFFEVVVRG